MKEVSAFHSKADFACYRRGYAFTNKKPTAERLGAGLGIILVAAGIAMAVVSGDLSGHIGGALEGMVLAVLVAGSALMVGAFDVSAIFIAVIIAVAVGVVTLTGGPVSPSFSFAVAAFAAICVGGSLLGALAANREGR